MWQRRTLFVMIGPHRGYGVAETTEVREIDDFGRRDERLLPPDSGSGFLWRIQSIARYEERDGGLYLELEALALTREIPASLNWLVAPVVNRLSIQSLMTTLRQTRDAVESRRGSVESLTACGSRSVAGGSA